MRIIRFLSNGEVHHGQSTDPSDRAARRIDGQLFDGFRVTDEVPRGVVCSLKGAWLRTSDNGQTVSALCPGHHADISEGACYNDTRVEVAALA